MTRRWAIYAILVCPALYMTGCVTTDEVAKFASTSSAALAKGPAILEDLKSSCEREELAGVWFERFDPSEAKEREKQKKAASKECEDIAKLVPDEVAISKALTLYFTAMSQLASGSPASASSADKSADKSADTTKTAAKSSAKGKMKSSATGATGGSASSSATGLPAELSAGHAAATAYLGIASTIAKWLTSAYVEKNVAEDVQAADPHIAVLTDTLASIVKDNYSQQLLAEKDARLRGYSVFLEKVANKPEQAGALPVIKVMFNQRWEDDQKTLAAKSDAADAYVKALHEIRDGHKKLADKSRQYKLGSMSGLLTSFTSGIESLLPTIQKAF